MVRLLRVVRPHRRPHIADVLPLAEDFYAAQGFEAVFRGLRFVSRPTDVSTHGWLPFASVQDGPILLDRFSIDWASSCASLTRDRRTKLFAVIDFCWNGCNHPGFLPSFGNAQTRGNTTDLQTDYQSPLERF